MLNNSVAPCVPCLHDEDFLFGKIDFKLIYCSQKKVYVRFRSQKIRNRWIMFVVLSGLYTSIVIRRALLSRFLYFLNSADSESVRLFFYAELLCINSEVSPASSGSAPTGLPKAVRLTI